MITVDSDLNTSTGTLFFAVSLFPILWSQSPYAMVYLSLEIKVAANSNALDRDTQLHMVVKVVTIGVCVGGDRFTWS